jgi:alpha-tubulin suppressor-like RCC1 family protein
MIEIVGARHCIESSNFFLISVAALGNVYACGETDGGKLGWPPSPEANSFTPQLVNGFVGKVVSVMCGLNHSVAITGIHFTHWQGLVKFLINSSFV